ncbi:MAG: alpha/beta fold hydrolase [Pseudomonadota bacterium]|nr:alpha/beta fold hydrolase [Pseudomonadota bacterium]
MAIFITIVICLLLFLLLGFRLVAYLFRWLEISNRPDYDPPPLDYSPYFPGHLSFAAFRAALIESLSSIIMVALLLAAWLRKFICRCFHMRSQPVNDNQTSVIVLVPGYLMNEGCMWILRWRLVRDGFTVRILEPVNKMSSIDNQARRLGKFIDTIINGDTSLTLIGHSMGGLVCRQYVAKYGHERQNVHRLITLGTPHRGTRLWSAGIGAVVRDLRPGSSFLAQLEEYSAGQCPRQRLSIASDFDELIIPNENADYPGAEHRKVHLVGHFMLVLSSRVYEHIHKFLNKS